MIEQLSLLDLPTPPAAPRARRRSAVRRTGSENGGESGAVVVESRYPEALVFLREHGPDAVAVLHLLAVEAEVVDGRLIARISTRGVARRLGFMSKDSAHRRMGQLRRAGVLEPLPSPSPWQPPTYVLHLDGTGTAVSRPTG